MKLRHRAIGRTGREILSTNQGLATMTPCNDISHTELGRAIVQFPSMASNNMSPFPGGHTEKTMFPFSFTLLNGIWSW